jgi:hypothetical protein
MYRQAKFEEETSKITLTVCNVHSVDDAACIVKSGEDIKRERLKRIYRPRNINKSDNCSLWSSLTLQRCSSHQTTLVIFVLL